jgi:hypothetical protein
MCEFFVRNSLPHLFLSRGDVLVGIGTFSHTNPHYFFSLWNASRYSLHMRILGLRNSGAEDSVRLRYETMWVGNCILTFRENVLSSSAGDSRVPRASLNA